MPGRMPGASGTCVSLSTRRQTPQGTWSSQAPDGGPFSQLTKDKLGRGHPVVACGPPRLAKSPPRTPRTEWTRVQGQRSSVAMEVFFLSPLLFLIIFSISPLPVRPFAVRRVWGPGFCSPSEDYSILLLLCSLSHGKPSEMKILIKKRKRKRKPTHSRAVSIKRAPFWR